MQLYLVQKKKKIDIPKIMHPLINPLDEIRVLLMDNVIEWVKENQIFNYYWFSSKVLWHDCLLNISFSKAPYA